MRVNAQDNGVPVLEMPVHPLDLIRIHVRCGHLHSSRKINNHLVLRCGLPLLLDSCADVQSKIKLRARKALRRVLQDNLPVVISHILLYQLCPLDGDLLNLLPVLVEYHLSLKSGGRIINVDNGLLYATDGLKGSPDQMLSALSKHLNGHIVRDQLSLHKLP